MPTTTSFKEGPMYAYYTKLINYSQFAFSLKESFTQNLEILPGFTCWFSKRNYLYPQLCLSCVLTERIIFIRSSKIFKCKYW